MRMRLPKKLSILEAGFLWGILGLIPMGAYFIYKYYNMNQIDRRHTVVRFEKETNPRSYLPKEEKIYLGPDIQDNQ